jgi:hypothetical protein
MKVESSIFECDENYFASLLLEMFKTFETPIYDKSNNETWEG